MQGSENGRDFNASSQRNGNGGSNYDWLPPRLRNICEAYESMPAAERRKLDEEAAKEEALEQAAFERDLAESMMRRRGFGNYCAVQFDDKVCRKICAETANEAAYQKCKTYAESFDFSNGFGVTIAGPVGSGKTYLAACIVKRLLLRYPNMGVEFITATDYLSQMMGFNPDEALLYSLQQKKILVLDDVGLDLGAWAGSQVQAALYRLLNERYNKQFPTIITTNLSSSDQEAPMDLERFLGARVMDRLLERNAGIRLAGGNLRERTEYRIGEMDGQGGAQ